MAIAVVRQTLTATGSGTTDFTSSGIGDIDFALIIACRANATNNPQDGAALSIGMWDGTNQRCCSFWDQDNVAVANNGRYSNDALGVIIDDDGDTISNVEAGFAVSAITDGIRLTMSFDNTTFGFFCTVVLCSGINADLHTFTPASTNGGTASITGLSYAPTAILAIGIGENTADEVTSNAVWALGTATSSGDCRMVAIGHDDGADPSNNSLLVSESHCAAQIFNGSQQWGLEATSWNSDGVTFTTRVGATGSDICFIATLEGMAFEIGTLTTPATATDDDISLSIDPAALILAMTTATSVDSVVTGTGSDGLSIGASDGTNDYAHTATIGDDLGTTNTRSQASASQVIDVDEDDAGTFADVADATVSSLGATTTLNYTDVPTTAIKGIYIAVGSEIAETSAQPSRMTPPGIISGPGKVIGY